tara:strand:+ start:72 stop:6425 length:6354 start_codon:yes stop_codon:yes gene_type:complete
MPEIKHTFTGGKMNKDLDERLVPNGEYRDAMNIQVRTTDGDSEGIGNAGVVQNIEGNKFIAIGTFNWLQSVGTTKAIGCVSDEKTNSSYFFHAAPVPEYNNNDNLSSIISFPVSDVLGETVFTDGILEVKANGDYENVFVDKFAIIDTLSGVMGTTPTWPSAETNNNDSQGVDFAFNRLRVLENKYRVGMRVHLQDTNGDHLFFDNGEIGVEIIDIKKHPLSGLWNLILKTPQSVDLSALATAAGDNLPNHVFKFTRERVLEFNPRKKLTGINVIDDLLIWTDGENEPKKINITRSKRGTTTPTNYQNPAHTKLFVKSPSLDNAQLVTIASLENVPISDIKKEHITVIRKAPVKAPTIFMKNTDKGVSTNLLLDNYAFMATGATSLPEEGDMITVPWPENVEGYAMGDAFTFVANDGTEPTTIKATIVDNGSGDYYFSDNNGVQYFYFKLTYVDPNLTENDTFWQITLEQKIPLFETKFGRFGYRYQYEDNEYSTFSPWSELVFLPSTFSYTPSKGYNDGMTNNIRQLIVKNFIPDDSVRPTDVKCVDLLWKTSDNSNVYVIKSIRRGVDPEWIDYTNPDNENEGYIKITSEMIHKVLPNNQLIRGWDNVPKKAIAQEITGNRLIYGNYEQGYNIEDAVGLKQSMSSTTIPINQPTKSVKSIREYKFGMVFGDKYNRETPVIANGYSSPDESFGSYYSAQETQTTTGDIVVKKDLSSFSNQFMLMQNWDDIGATPPEWMEYVKYYVKETSNEYYNLVMDRWYEAEDGNIWLSFPSADRNKVDEETYLILKNEHGTQSPIVDKTKYKIIAIENEAPDFIKMDNRSMGEVHLGRGYVYSNPDQNAVTTVTPDLLYNTKSITIGAGEWADAGGIQRSDFEGTPKVRVKAYYYNDNTVDGDGVPTGPVIATGKGPWVTVSRLNAGYYEQEGIGQLDGKLWLKRAFTPNEVDMYLEIAQNQGFTDIVQANVDNNEPLNDDYLHYFLEFKDEVLENKPEFDGRFFVKIEKDDVVRRRVCHEHQGEYLADFSFDIAYIEPKTVNPANVLGEGATYENWTWADESAVVSGQDVFEDFNEANIANEFADDSTLNIYNTQSFWNWWYLNKSTNIFLDKSPVNPNYSWPGYPSGAVQQQAAFAEITGQSLNNISLLTNDGAGIGGPLGLHKIMPNSGGLAPNPGPEYGIMFFSTVGENFQDELASIFKSRMQTEGTLFRFKQDPNSSIYQVTKYTIDGETPNFEFNFPNNANLSGQATNYSGDIDPLYGNPNVRNTIMVTFVRLNNQGEPAPGRGININDWDPRGVVRHDGITTGGGSGELTIEFVTLQSDDELSDDSILSNNACWETEPKEDVGLDIYYEASNGIPMVLKSNNLQNFVKASKIKDNASKIATEARTQLQGGDAQTLPEIETFNYTGEPYVYSFHLDNVIRIKRNDSNDNEVDFIPETTPISAGTNDTNKGGLAVNDVIRFEHTDGTITRSRIIDHVGYSLVDDLTETYTPSVRFVIEGGVINTGTIGFDAGYGIPETQQVSSILFPSNALYTNDLIDLAENGTTLSNNQTCGIEVTGVGIKRGTFVSGVAFIPQLMATVVLLNKVQSQDLGGTFTFTKVTGYYALDTNVYKYPTTLGWFNCYSFGNGVESDRIRDDFNAPQIDNGIKVSSTYLEYGEETKGSGLIYSGLYNSTSGTNELNQFNIGEKITKDLNPSYGSIQALKTRDTNLVTFTEDKVLKVLSNKDAVFNADGNPQLTATNRVLGQAVPFVGDYGISKNPESLAVDQYRMYFADKQRGAILRLSNDGLTPISNIGMKSWFRENLKKADNIIGTYDVVNGEYNVTLDVNESLWSNGDSTTVSFNEGSKGWVSFKSFLPNTGLSISGKYFTAYHSVIYEHYVDNVNRNNFYGFFEESAIEVVFNDLPSVVKSFKTVNYEGTQSKVTQHTNVDNSTGETTIEDAAGNTINDLTDGNYYNLQEKDGWYIDAFQTDLQSGEVFEFIKKENKWFNKITGNSVANESEFSVQGLGFPLDVSVIQPLEAPINIQEEGLAGSYFVTSNTDNPGEWAIFTTITGGVEPYSYSWSASEGGVIGTVTASQTEASQSGAATSAIEALSTGNYILTVTDGIGNTLSLDIDIN